MKKLIHIILVVSYLFQTGGLTMYRHYCMGEYVAATLFKSAGKTCPACGMDKHEADGCCDDIGIKLKTPDRHIDSRHFEELVPPLKECSLLGPQYSHIHLPNLVPPIDIQYRPVISPPRHVRRYLELNNLRI